MQPVHTTLLTIPTDIKGILLGYLDGRSLTKLRGTCKALQTLIDKSSQVWKDIMAREFTDYPLPAVANWRRLYKDHAMLVCSNKNPKVQRRNYSVIYREELAQSFNEEIREEENTPWPVYGRFTELPRAEMGYIFQVNPDRVAIDKIEIQSKLCVYQFVHAEIPVRWFVLAHKRLIVIYQQTRQTYPQGLYTRVAIWNILTHECLKTFNLTIPCGDDDFYVKDPKVISHVLYLTVQRTKKESSNYTYTVSTRYFDLATGSAIGSRVSDPMSRPPDHVVKDGYIFEFLPYELRGARFYCYDLRSHQPTLMKQVYSYLSLFIGH